MKKITKHSNSLLHELNLHMQEALEKEKALEKAITEKDYELVTYCRNVLLQHYRDFSVKIYRIMEEHLNDLDSLASMVKDLQEQMNLSDEKLQGLTEANQYHKYDSLLNEITQNFKETGQLTKPVWLFK